MSDSDSSLPPNGSSLERAFKALVTVLNAREIPYAIIGGIATIQHSRVRTTDDIDALLAVTQIATPGLFDALRDSGFAIDTLKSQRELKEGGMTTIKFETVVIDLMRPVLPVYAHVIDRAVDTEILGQLVRVSSAEGLIIMKLIAFRPQDQVDIKELIVANRDMLDWDYIRNEFGSVAEDADPRWAYVKSLIAGT